MTSVQGVRVFVALLLFQDAKCLSIVTFYLSVLFYMLLEMIGSPISYLLLLVFSRVYITVLIIRSSPYKPSHMSSISRACGGRLETNCTMLCSVLHVCAMAYVPTQT